jgi:hypothetical protein
MLLTYFIRDGWESWDLGREPLIRQDMPVLIDDDLRFEDEHGPRPTVGVNAWLRELPISGVPAAKSWRSYAQAMRSWLEFLASRSMHPFAERADLRAALGAFAEYRLAGPVEARWDGATWNHRVNVMSRFCSWAVDNDHCTKVPFTYAMGTRYSREAGAIEARRNTATVRRAKPHVTMKYVEPEFRDTFLRALAGLDPDGVPDDSFRGRELARNAAVGGLVTAAGLRAQEFTYLLTYELPSLPARRTPVPVWFPLAESTAKGQRHAPPGPATGPWRCGPLRVPGRSGRAGPLREDLPDPGADLGIFRRGAGSVGTAPLDRGPQACPPPGRESAGTAVRSGGAR